MAHFGMIERIKIYRMTSKSVRSRLISFTNLWRFFITLLLLNLKILKCKKFFTLFIYTPSIRYTHLLGQIRGVCAPTCSSFCSTIRTCPCMTSGNGPRMKLLHKGTFLNRFARIWFLLDFALISIGFRWTDNSTPKNSTPTDNSTPP